MLASVSFLFLSSISVFYNPQGDLTFYNKSRLLYRSFPSKTCLVILLLYSQKPVGALIGINQKSRDRMS